jgi:hypothetical protein
MAKPKKPKSEDTRKARRDAGGKPVEPEASDEILELSDEADDDLVVADDEEVAPLSTEEEAVVADPEEDISTLAGDGDEAEVADAEEEVSTLDAGDEAVAAEEDVSTLAGDADAADAAPPEDVAEDEEEAPPPEPRVTMGTLVLCILVLLASAGACVVVALDHGKRQEWSYAVYLHDLALMGLPLAEETEGRSASREMVPLVRIEPADVNKAFSKRPGVERKGSEPFKAVEEIFAPRIQPEDLGPDTLAILFKGLGEPVKTLEQEVERIKSRLPQDIDLAAQEAAKKEQGDVAGRKLAEKVLLPLARTPDQVYALDKKIQAAKGAELSALIEKGTRLRLIEQVLDPLNEERPVQPKNRLLESLADLDNAKVVEEAEALLKRRIDAVTAERHDPELLGEEWAGKERTSIEKRQAIAYLLYTISQVKKPDGTLLYPQGPERTEVVVGLNEFTHAADRYAVALQAIQERVTRFHQYELAGYRFKDADKIESLPAFVQQYPEEIRNIQDLRAVIKNREFRLKELQGQVEQLKRQLADRQQHYDTVQKELLGARAETARLVGDLQVLQRQYFEAQRRLSDAAEVNAQKEKLLRKLERR